MKNLTVLFEIKNIQLPNSFLSFDASCRTANILVNQNLFFSSVLNFFIFLTAFWEISLSDFVNDFIFMVFSVLVFLNYFYSDIKSH